MLHPERIPGSDAEHEAVDKLIEAHPDESVSITRRDADNTGPLLVHIGDDTYQVAADGKRKKVT